MSYDTHEESWSHKGPIAWMARNSVASNLLMFLVLVGGLLSVLSVKQEVFPEFDLDIVQISVPYPGASPAEVEQGIVLAVEEAVRGVDGVKKITSSSAEGAGVTAVELLIGADPQKALQDIKNEVDRIQTFPEEAEDPQVALASRKQKVVALVISGDQTLSTLHGIAEKARADLIARGGVTQIEVEGIPPLEVAIEIDRATLRAQGLTLDQVAAQVGFASLELPGGGIDTESGELLVRVSDRRRTAAEFRDIILRAGPGGAEVRLGDIATITDGFEDTDQATVFNGKPAVLVTAYRVGSEAPSGVAEAVKSYVPVLRTALPRGMEVTTWDDDSELLRDRIDLLIRNAQSGILLVLIVLALFLDLRLAFWVGLGIPISFMGAFFMFPQFDVSVNMISLFALIITLGLVVDDAIVVGENIYEKAERGMDPLRAAIEGAKEMAMPVTFAILTTFAAFAPLLFVPGTSGKIFGVIPLVVLSVLFFSLLESFYVLPAHLAHGAHASKKGIVATITRIADVPRSYVSRGLAYFIERIYDPILAVFIEWRYASLAGATALFFVAVGLVASGLLPFSFMPKTEADLVRVNARLPYGVSIERTDEVRAKLETALQQAIDEVGAQDGLRGTLTLVGSGPASFGPAAGGRPVGSHLLSMEVDLVPTDEREFSTAQLAKAWEEAVPPLPGVESLTFVKDIGPSGGAAVDVQLTHTDTTVLAAASQEVTEALRGYPQLTSINNGYAAGKPQLDFTLLPNARTLGLTSADVARQIRSAFYGAEAIREQRGRNEIKVMARLPEQERVSEFDLEQLEIRTPMGAWVPLASVAQFERSQAATTISRDSGQRVVDVTAELAAGQKSTRAVLDDLTADVLPALQAKYPGLGARFAGEQESQNESLANLGQNYLFALLVMFALLAVPFKSYIQPMIIMSAIPFGFVGAVGGHVLMGFELSLISVMGIIALSGVVVNDSLVLVDAANNFRSDGMSNLEAITAAGKRRMRPILLTSFTTFFGLLPMIFEPSVQARFLIPMAISLGFGVLFSTLITLLVVPALYMIIEDIISLWTWFWEDTDHVDEPVEDAPAT